MYSDLEPNNVEAIVGGLSGLAGTIILLTWLHGDGGRHNPKADSTRI